MGNLKKAEKHEEHGFSQFELSKNVLHNLKHFDLTPTGKLVLLILVDCYNPENNAVVFPSMEFIADMAGIGLTATKQAIRDLILTGCIIKSKRGKIRGNYNKYLLTRKIQYRASERAENENFTQSQKSDNDLLKSSENDRFKQSDSDCFHEEQKIEQKNNNVVDYKILKEYAEKYGAKNVNSYINVLRKNGIDKKIIADFKAAKAAENYAKNQILETKKLVNTYNDMISEPPPEIWLKLREKLRSV